MYITKLTHFLDDDGNIPRDMPKEARELANFLALVVDSITGTSSLGDNDSRIRCFEKGCEGTIKSEITIDTSVHWICPVCGNEGIISEWQATKWNNMK